MSPEIIKAVEDGLRFLKFSPADAQLQYRFEERHHDFHSGTRPMKMNQDMLGMLGREAGRLQLLSFKQGVARKDEVKAASHHEHAESNGESGLSMRFSSKEENDGKRVGDLKKGGLYTFKGILEMLKKKFTEPQRMLKRIKFPRVAYKDVRKLELNEDVRARTGKIQ